MTVVESGGVEKRIRFKKEKFRVGYIPQEGSFESVLVGVRDMLPEDVHTTGEGDTFVDVDRKATLKLEQACFQFFMAGRGHIALAERVINSFPQMRAGAVSEQEKEQIVLDLAVKIYDHYPVAYKAQVKK